MIGKTWNKNKFLIGFVVNNIKEYIHLHYNAALVTSI